jgi:hypothetical protein
MTLAIAWLNVSGENPSGWLNVLGDPHTEGRHLTKVPRLIEGRHLTEAVTTLKASPH